MKPWTITWGARTWTDENLLAADLAAVQLLLGGSWENLDPWSGPVQLMAMIAALECRASDRNLDEVMQEIRESPATDVLDAIRERPLVEVT